MLLLKKLLQGDTKHPYACMLVDYCLPACMHQAEAVQVDDIMLTAWDIAAHLASLLEG